VHKSYYNYLNRATRDARRPVLRA